MQIPVGLVSVFIRFESSLTKEIHPSASASGLFPLWLRRPRFLCAPRFLASIACGLSGSGVALVWGKDASFPQLGFILVPSDSTFAQPPSSFAYESLVVSLPLRVAVPPMFVGLRPLAMDAHSGNSPEANTKCLPLPPVRAYPAARRGGAPYKLDFMH